MKAPFFRKHGIKVATTILLIQTLFFGISVLEAPEAPSYKHYYVGKEDKFSYSNKDNVIVVLIDTFQSDLFSKILAEHPEYLDKFSGFTYFPDAVGGYPTTYPSIPLILTGMYYDNSRPIQTFMKDAYLSSGSALLNYRGKGYKVYAKCNFMVYCDLALESNIIIRPSKVINLSFLPQSLDIIKLAAGVRVPAQMVTNPDKLFLEQATTLSKVVDQVNGTFKFYYLAGTHPPFIFDENLNNVKPSLDILGFNRQALGELKIIFTMFDILNKLGVYDNSRLIIVADHGTGILPDTANKVRNAAIPLVLVKDKNQRGKLVISQERINLAEVSKFINGGTMNNVETRPFYYYDWANGWDKEYLPSMTEYFIQGESWDTRSYKISGKIFNPKI